MIDIRTFLVALALIISIAGCSISTEDLTNEVRSSIEEQLKGEDITVKSFLLTHKGGNEYRGILETKEPNGNFTYAVDVVFDGRAFTWEIAN